MMKTPQPLHLGQAIRTELTQQGISVAEFADQLGLQRPNCYRIIRAESMDTNRLFLVSQLLHHDFFAEYSRQLVVNSEHE